jgi:cytochrome b subunit of formate dehydrogenase/mono/diheme cytochrome c family protein
MLLSFTTLAITGLAQKFALSPISLFTVRLWGGIENLRATHHVAAAALMVIVIVHLLEIGYKVFVLRTRLSMLPGFRDAKDAWMALTYNLGFGRSRPQMGRYTFEEKAEYWSLVWGTLIMGLTGFMMWNPLATVGLLPGEFIPAAKAAHGAEAILAVLAIIVWHLYAVHLKRFNKSMWIGNLTEEEMLHEHPLELADLKAGIGGDAPDASTIRRRGTVYYPVAVLAAAALLFAVYGFVGGEQTAITTIPPQLATVVIYVPQTPTLLPPTATPVPSPTPAEAAETVVSAPVTWAEVGPVLAARCSACHGPSLATAGMNLSTFVDAMRGGQGGLIIIAGDAANSKMILVQSNGGHPGQLSAEELALVRAWIDAGALEK